MFIDFIIWSSFLVPWLSLFFLDKQTIKRFMPVAIFASLLVTVQNELAYTYKWWVVKETILPQIITYFPFVYGAFLVGTIWIFYFTFGNFKLYLLINLAIDALFAFPLNEWFESLGLYKLVNYTNWEILFTFTLMAVLIYLYQLWQQEVLKGGPE